MDKTNVYNCNLNIRYDLPGKEWQKITALYERMPGWLGYVQGIPHWFGKDEDAIMITASVEPSGLFFHAEMDEDGWERWIGTFKSEASKVLGFEVGEPEDGFV
ncbi:hypothetical protein [Saccharibacillus kuerlensis]|uniref:Uncharacterized protein n=1 Tax=Saccharibacillus kuerlensis TaxID=459527 RepID=A0ABQ2L3L9_9BACL|nr:hypothetical protein [Saccharibacillus kuerlensis]GGO01100.1 hypothetical protein GCM10010969_23020 [Saccharibacillus kuerlensis]